MYKKIKDYITIPFISVGSGMIATGVSVRQYYIFGINQRLFERIEWQVNI